MNGSRWEDRGQASVELALALPLVAIMALGVIQVGVVGYRQVLVVHAAREGARAAAVVDGYRPGVARDAVARSGGLDQARVGVAVQDEADRVTVVVRYRDDTDIPLVGVLLPPLDLRASATMRVESR